MRENADQNNSEYRPFSPSVSLILTFMISKAVPQKVLLWMFDTCLQLAKKDGKSILKTTQKACIGISLSIISFIIPKGVTYDKAFARLVGHYI